MVSERGSVCFEIANLANEMLTVLTLIRLRVINLVGSRKSDENELSESQRVEKLKCKSYKSEFSNLHLYVTVYSIGIVKYARPSFVKTFL